MDQNINLFRWITSVRDILWYGTDLKWTETLAHQYADELVININIYRETEIKVLERGLDFAPSQNCINGPELRKDFVEFCRKMRIKWHFRNEITEHFSTTPVFRPKSN